MGGSGVFIDTEKTWDEERAAEIGVDVENNFGIGDADSIEAGFRMVQKIVESKKKHKEGKPFVVVIDSITGTATEYLKSREIGEEPRVGQDARAIRTGMRQIIADVAESKINLFMINHAIAKMATHRFAKQSEAAGGHAIKIFSTIRCSMANIAWIPDPDNKDKRLGQKIGIRIEKLKGSRLDYPQVKEIPLLNTIGFDTEASLLAAGIKSGWVHHEEHSQSYTLGDLEFPKIDWPSIVLQHGGIDAAYQEFIDWCIAEGKMKPWAQPVT
jgi:RecA/RadA recombinase